VAAEGGEAAPSARPHRVRVGGSIARLSRRAKGDGIRPA
jgi:hypothetical protein